MSGDKPSTDANVDAELLDSQLWGVGDEEEQDPDPVAQILVELGKVATPPVQVEQNLTSLNYLFFFTNFLYRWSSQPLTLRSS